MPCDAPVVSATAISVGHLVESFLVRLGSESRKDSIGKMIVIVIVLSP